MAPVFRPAGLYVHIPFCLQKCAYCDFASYAGLEHLYADYVWALRQEIASVGPCTRYDTIFIGGGTPTVLGATSLASILESCYQQLHLAQDGEVTVEANPGTVDVPQLEMLRQAGVNRLSLGVQSLCDRELALLGRIHTAAEAEHAYRLARDVGYTNISVDLIFGLPGQSLQDWESTLEQAILWEPEHLSLYALMIEEGTYLAWRVATGELSSLPDDLAADMYELAEARLAGSGYVHYEISNWAHSRAGMDLDGLPQLACAHNLKYWRNQTYTGVGAAAYSYDGQRRTGNTADVQEYIRRMRHGESPQSQAEETDAERHMGETMMLGLRLVRGITREDFAERFGLVLDQVYGREIFDLVEDGLLEADAQGIRLTPRGRLLGNRVFSAFLR